MEQVLNAVYENGVFKPFEHPGISEGQTVRLIVQSPSKTEVDDMLSLAAQVYEGLSEEEIDEIERIALDRSRFFEDGNTWK